MDWLLHGSGLANSTVDASCRLVQSLQPLAVAPGALSLDLGSDCAAELVKVSPTDSAIVYGVGAGVLDNTLRVDRYRGSTDRMGSDREEQRVLVPAIVTKMMEASRRTV